MMFKLRKFVSCTSLNWIDFFRIILCHIFQIIAISVFDISLKLYAAPRFRLSVATV